MTSFWQRHKRYLAPALAMTVMVGIAWSIISPNAEPTGGVESYAVADMSFGFRLVPVTANGEVLSNLSTASGEVGFETPNLVERAMSVFTPSLAIPLRVYEGDSRCPSGQMWNGARCVQTGTSNGGSGTGPIVTPPATQPDPGNCPLGTYWAGTACRGGDRSCPSGQVFNYYKGRCVQMNGQEVPPPGSSPPPPPPPPPSSGNCGLPTDPGFRGWLMANGYTSVCPHEAQNLFNMYTRSQNVPVPPPAPPTCPVTSPDCPGYSETKPTPQPIICLANMRWDGQRCVPLLDPVRYYDIIVPFKIEISSQNIDPTTRIDVVIKATPSLGQFAAQSQRASLDPNGGVASGMSFMWRAVPADQVGLLVFTLSANAAGIDQRGIEVTAQASTTVSVRVGKPGVTVTPLSLVGTGADDGNRASFSATLRPKEATG